MMIRAVLVLTLAIAITASVFAIWPVVADAPWQADPVVVEVPVGIDRTNEIRCEQALELRERLLIESHPVSGSSNEETWKGWMAQLRGEIRDYC